MLAGSTMDWSRAERIPARYADAACAFIVASSRSSARLTLTVRIARKALSRAEPKAPTLRCASLLASRTPEEMASTEPVATSTQSSATERSTGSMRAIRTIAPTRVSAPESASVMLDVRAVLSRVVSVLTRESKSPARLRSWSGTGRRRRREIRCRRRSKTTRSPLRASG